MDAQIEQLTELDEPKKIDDASMGDDFVNEYVNKLAFLWGEWHRYDPDTGIWQSADRYSKRCMIDHLKRFRRWKIKVTAARAKAVLEYCENYLPELDHIPANFDVIPMQNGAYNVRTGVLHPHTPSTYFRHGLPFEWNPNAECERWWQTLEQILVYPNGQTDYDLISFVQEAMGYCFWGDNRLQAAFLFYGDGGTGKSTVVEVLQSMIPSAKPIELETLNDYQMATLVDVRLAIVSEIEEGATFPEAAFKRLLSSDLVQARFPHGRPFSFQPICTVVGAMNSLPRVKDRSKGVFRRVFIVPFHHAIENPDVYLPSKLQKEQAGIFAWAMSGLKRLRERGRFDPPQQVLDANHDWQYRNDTEKQFLGSEYVELDPNGMIHTKEMYQYYKEWCRQNGNYAKSKESVAKDWKRLGLESKRKSDGMYWLGVTTQTKNIDLSHL